MLRPQILCYYRLLLKQIMNMSYSMNPVCPKIYFQLSSISKNRSSNFRGFTDQTTLFVTSSFYEICANKSFLLLTLVSKRACSPYQPLKHYLKIADVIFKFTAAFRDKKSLIVHVNCLHAQNSNEILNLNYPEKEERNHKIGVCCRNDKCFKG